MVDIAMVVIPEPAEGSRSVLKHPENPLVKPFPYVTSDGPINYVCGGCETVLAKGLESASQITNLVLLCTGCGAYNETRT